MLTFDQYQSAAFESDDAYSSDRSHDDQITRVSLALVAAVHEFNGTDAGYRSDAIVIACKVLRRLSLLNAVRGGLQRHREPGVEQPTYVRAAQRDFRGLPAASS